MTKTDLETLYINKTKEKAPSHTFGLPLRDLARSETSEAIGPGTYSQGTTLGKQLISTRASPPRVGMGTSTRAAEEYVVGDGAGDEKGLLRHHRRAARRHAQRASQHIALAPRRSEKRRFAAADGPNQRDQFTGGHLDVESAENLDRRLRRRLRRLRRRPRAAISAPLLPLRGAAAAVRSRSCCIVLADIRR